MTGRGALDACLLDAVSRQAARRTHHDPADTGRQSGPPPCRSPRLRGPHRQRPDRRVGPPVVDHRGRVDRGKSLRWLTCGSQRPYTQSGKLPARHPPNVQEYRFSSGNLAIGGNGLQKPMEWLESQESQGNSGFLAGFSRLLSIQWLWVRVPSPSLSHKSCRIKDLGFSPAVAVAADRPWRGGARDSGLWGPPGRPARAWRRSSDTRSSRRGSPQNGLP